MLKLDKNNTNVKKIIFLFILAILLQIPIFFISGVINDREYSYKKMVEEIGNEWGKKQTVAGPFLMIPYKYTESKKDDNGNTIKNLTERYFIILPEELKINTKLTNDVRKRGIYKSIVYNSEISIEGNFSNIKKVIPENISTEKLYVGMAIGDTKSLMKVEEFKLEGKEVKLESGTGSRQEILNSGISGKLDKELLNQEKVDFKIKFNLRGSEGIELLPFGSNNYFVVESTWKNPKFYGVLPNEKNITENSFRAEWIISSFVRNYKQAFADETFIDLKEGCVGVDLYQGVSHYRQIIRSIKYSILFIMFSLFVVYIFEILNKKFTHYIQYGVVGFSLVLFYLVLLSMSEYFSFSLAYIIASLMIVIPNSLYIKAVTQNKKYGVGMFVFLSAVYLLLYSILKMEQYALITGTILIMLMLYVIMYITKNIDASV